MNGVTAKNDVPIGPAPKELGTPIIEVPLFNAFSRGVVKDVVNLVTPSLVERLDVPDKVLRGARSEERGAKQGAKRQAIHC